MSIKVGETQISNLNIGEMGIKRVLAGDAELYNRTGGYFYLEINTKGETNNG